MNGLRDLAAQCGEPTALAQLSNTVTAVNPSVLADAQAYKQQTVPMQNPLELQQRPMLHQNDMMKEFQSHPRPQQIHPPNPTAAHLMQQSHMLQAQQKQAQDIAMQMSREFDEKMKQKNKEPAQMAPVVYRGPPQAQQGMMLMPNPIMPQMMMPMMDPYLARMMQPPMMPQNVQQQKQPESKEEDGISTNGTQEMQDEKSVQEQLENLTPNAQDQEAIKNLLKNTSDPEMQNSEFFKLLKKISDKKAEPTQEDINQQMAAEWEKQFQNWDPTANMNWGSYMDSINPVKASEPVYEFAQNNPYMGKQVETTESLSSVANTEEIVEKKEEEQIVDNINYFEEGKRLMKEGNLNEAIMAFEACVKKEPNHSEAWRYLGQCHADNENETPAIAAFLRCHEIDPYDLEALLALGVSYTNEIDPYRALQYLRQWIANHPDYAVLAQREEPSEEKEMMGGWLGSKREHAKVAELFLQALKINGQDADLHIVLGVLYNITSEYDKAELHFKRALQQRPKDPTLWNKLGATQANGQNYSAAVTAYYKALQLKENYVRALSNLGISFANQNMHVKACQSYLASLKRNPSAETVWDHLQMSLMHLNRGDLVDLVAKRDVSLFKKHFEF